MGRQAGYLYGLNAGVFSEEASQRVDQRSARVAGEVQTNLLPRVLGPAIFRPGTEFVLRTADGERVHMLPFDVSGDNSSAILELTPSEMRVVIDGEYVTRPNVSTNIGSSTFGNLTNWTVNNETGGSASISDGRLVLSGTGTSRGRIHQQIDVTVADRGVEHAIEIEVVRGAIYFSVGNNPNNNPSNIVPEQRLTQGVHSLAFTPTTSTFYVSLSWDGVLNSLVEYCRIAPTGVMVLDTPWGNRQTIRQLQTEQSGDIMYLAHQTTAQRQIERRSQTSWSVVDYLPPDGPFQLENTTDVSIDPGGKTGAVQLVSSRPLFEPGHINSLWRLTHNESSVSQTITGEDQWTDPIRVSGLEPSERRFQYVTPNSTASTVRIQRAFGSPSGWSNVGELSNLSGADNYFDDRDNEIIFYRIGVDVGDYQGSDGAFTVELNYTSRSQDGIVRIRGYQSPTQVVAEVLQTLGSQDPTTFWSAPEWSDVTGWPGSVALFDGRMWWGGRDRVFGSISDAYLSFDDRFEGDAGTINRSVSSGSFERVIWLLGLQRLLAGTRVEEISMRSSSFDEPMTPTEFTARSASTRGSSDDVAAVKIDSYGIFVHRNGVRVFELSYTSDAQDYTSFDLTRFAPEICEPGVVQVAWQRTPDTRVWFVLDDGTAACLLYERDEDAVAWIKVELGGNSVIESVAVLPGGKEDEVYFAVDRGGVRTIERLARLDEATGGPLNKNLDGHVVYTGAATNTISGLDHLNGLNVSVWANGTVYENRTVSAGSVTLPASVTAAVVGVPYVGRFLSVNLDYGAQLGVAVGRPQKLTGVSLIMKDVAPEGVRVGPDLDNLVSLPATYNGRPLAAGEVVPRYVHDVFPGGGFERDARIAFEIRSPYPGTFLGALFDMETGEGLPPPERSG